MPRNPFAHPLFLPVFLRVMLLIVVGLAAVVLSQRRSLRVWRRSTLFLRARTWFVIGPLFVLAVFIGGLLGVRAHRRHRAPLRLPAHPLG